ncbi:colanic acid biosynthesis glycosyltransferase WcaC [Ideonella sp. 4Y16]|uniref:glycosyltransferase n=1 Tax=Ideonella alba TaxID=2824118 RepID=UPI001B379C24|nr:glycosyltransferase [Ideonella alba]MBQ0943124.1 colanic acid biosynthesis glycosyltransferase WcaC [Ideonella alba]
MKKILQVNVRLTEGGAAQVALALHQGLDRDRFNSTFAYGYSKGVKRHVSEGAFRNVVMVGDRFSTAFLFAQNRLIGSDPSFPNTPSLSRLKSLAEHSDLVHLHVIHSYFLQYRQFLTALERLGKPIVWTLHDHWAVTGRCAFLDGCDSWKDGCGRCKSGENYPPSILDFSRRERATRQSELTNISSQCTYVSPSEHLLNDFRSVFPNCKCARIPNSISSSIEERLKPISDLAASGCIRDDTTTPIHLLVVAHDLAYAGKTNHALIERVIRFSGVKLTTIGKNSPFTGPNVLNLGELHDRSRLVDEYTKADALLFTSKVDNFPLTICEALCCGLPVLATDSPAAGEVLNYVGAASLSEEAFVRCIQNSTWTREITAYSDRQSLASTARNAFSSKAMVSAYQDLYSRLLG